MYILYIYILCTNISTRTKFVLFFTVRSPGKKQDSHLTGTAQNKIEEHKPFHLRFPRSFVPSSESKQIPESPPIGVVEHFLFFGNLFFFFSAADDIYIYFFFTKTISSSCETTGTVKVQEQFRSSKKRTKYIY